jgi:hypothetical protein
MANFSINASPSMNQLFNFNSSYSMQAITPSINNVTSGWNRNSFAQYASQTFFRYRVYCTLGSGIVRVTYPLTSGPSNDYTSPWFRLGDPPYITITATPSSGYTFNGWWQGSLVGSFISSLNPYNIGGTEIAGLDIFADFQATSSPTYDYYYADRFICATCAQDANSILVVVTAGYPVGIGSFYSALSPDGYSYRITGSAPPGAGLILYEQAFPSCAFACFI